MSWNSFIQQVCEDKANAIVFGHSARLTGAAQHAYIKYNKGLTALHNAIDKHLPAAIEKAKAQKNKNYIDYLERQGYVVLTKAEAEELETRPV
mgnify:CR=1 FL=1